MCCNKQAHTLIKATLHKTLCAKLNTFILTFEEMLLTSNVTTIHTKNLQLLVIEIFKSLNQLNPEFMWKIFTLRDSTYNLRQGSSLVIPNARTSRAINSFDFRAALAWNHLPSKLKEEKTLSKFALSLKSCYIYCKCKNCT